VSILPPLNKIIGGFSAGQVFITVLDLAFGLFREPIIPNALDLLVAVLSKAKEQKIIIDQCELSTVVANGVGKLVNLLHLINIV
jgi:hypothetical protein